MGDFVDELSLLIQKSDVDLVDMCQNALDTFRSANRLEINKIGVKFFLESSESFVLNVSSSIKIYIMSILDNALKSVEEKAALQGAEYNPTIRISIASARPPSGSSIKEYVSISIRDNGLGVTRYQLDELREFRVGRRFRTKYGGRGFGLVAANKFMRELGGWLEVESKESCWFAVTFGFRVS